MVHAFHSVCVETRETVQPIQTGGELLTENVQWYVCSLSQHALASYGTGAINNSWTSAISQPFWPNIQPFSPNVQANENTLHIVENTLRL